MVSKTNCLDKKYQIAAKISTYQVLVVVLFFGKTKRSRWFSLATVVFRLAVFSSASLIRAMGRRNSMACYFAIVLIV